MQMTSPFLKVASVGSDTPHVFWMLAAGQGRVSVPPMAEEC